MDMGAQQGVLKERSGDTSRDMWLGQDRWVQGQMVRQMMLQAPLPFAGLQRAPKTTTPEWVSEHHPHTHMPHTQTTRLHNYSHILSHTTHTGYTHSQSHAHTLSILSWIFSPEHVPQTNMKVATAVSVQAQPISWLNPGRCQALLWGFHTL